MVHCAQPSPPTPIQIISEKNKRLTDKSMIPGDASEDSTPHEGRPGGPEGATQKRLDVSL